MGEGESRNNLRQDDFLRRNADGATATRLTDPAITQNVEINQGSSPCRTEAATGNEVLLPTSLSPTNYLAVRSRLNHFVPGAIQRYLIKKLD